MNTRNILNLLYFQYFFWRRILMSNDHFSYKKKVEDLKIWP